MPPQDFEKAVTNPCLKVKNKSELKDICFYVLQVEPEILSTFTDVDLETMGIEDKKTRKTILKKIRKGLLDANT